MDLQRLTMTNLKATETSSGIAWTGTLCIDGERRLRVENRGDGGCNRYASHAPYAPNDYHVARKLQAELETAAREILGEDHEALDNLTCAMDNGINGTQGAEIWIRERAA